MDFDPLNEYRPDPAVFVSLCCCSQKTHRPTVYSIHTWVVIFQKAPEVCGAI